MTPTTFNPGKGAGSTVGIAILGYGTVGSQVLRLMVENADEFAHRTGGPLEVRGVAVSNKEKTRRHPRRRTGAPHRRRSQPH